ncbi:MAG TPA: tetratricopeptide repeat protein [Albitalea sp.]|jgi:tetratricopeptide (TPR) repeat protein|nr:tetratricopeptide repeat protein [Albitalea sp.]
METTMRFSCSNAAAAALLSMLAAVPSVQAAGGGGGGGGATFSTSRPDVARELEAAQQLIERKDWTGALVELKKALRRDRRNADVHNLMGYSYRKSGQLDEAFDSYRSALRLDPNHRGANEYIGEAYLQANQPDKAREHLVALKRICGGESCEEYQDLAKALAGWHPAASTAATPAAGTVK